MSNRETKVILAALAVAFGLFVVGYHGGKHLAKVEDSSQSSVQQK